MEGDDTFAEVADWPHDEATKTITTPNTTAIDAYERLRWVVTMDWALRFIV